MSETSEAPADEPHRWQWLGTYAAPALVLLAVIVPFLRFHQYNLLLPESLILISGAAAVGATVGLFSRIRPQTLGPMLLALVLCVYIFYLQRVTDALVAAAKAVAELIGQAPVLLACFGVAMFLVVCAVCILLRKHLNLIVSAVFGTIVATTIVLPTDTGGEPVETGALPKGLKDLPAVIHIILDEHIGLAGLPEGLQESEQIRRELPEVFKDFAYYPRAYSRFAETKFSLTSLMNRDVGSDVSGLMESDTYTFAPTQNAWFDALKQKGYAIKVYQSAWFDMCAYEAADACYTYSFFSPNAVQRAPLSTEQRLRALTLKLFAGRGALQLEPMVGMEALNRFRSDIESHPRGVAYIVHLLIPHYGYLYSDDCALLDPSQWEREGFGEDFGYTSQERIDLYRRYLPQLACADRQMASLFDELKRLGIYDEATIIVHGDHGSRIGERPYITEAPDSLDTQDLVDNYSTLLAFKAPGIAPGVHAEPLALQRFFADALLGGSRPDSPGAGDIFIRVDENDHFAALRFPWDSPSAPDAVSPAAAIHDVSDASNILGELRR